MCGELKKKSYCGFKKLLCKAVFQFCFQEFAVQSMERKVWLLPASHNMLIQTKRPSLNVRAKEESCKPSDSSEESGSARDSLAVVRALVPSTGPDPRGFCFSSLALLTTV